MYKRNVIAVSSGDHKLASLFFDKVIPLHSYNSVPQELIDDLFKSHVEKMSEDVKIGFDRPADCDNCPIKTDCTSYQNNPKHNCRDIFANVFAKLMQGYHEELIKDEVDVIPIFNSQESLYKFIRKGYNDALEIILNGIKLIKTNNASWEQILEIRDDEDAIKKLRNFRLFIYNNYSGKSPSYIEDSINKIIDEYEESCKKHGFELILSSLSQLLDSKSFLASVFIAMFGILKNADACVYTGAGISISKIAIELLSKRLDFESKKTNHELAYVFSIQQKIN